MDVGSQLSTQVSSNWKWAEALDGSQTPAAFCLAHEAGLFGLLSHFVILENNAVQFRLIPEGNKYDSIYTEGFKFPWRRFSFFS